jgi:hypothetical protein
MEVSAHLHTLRGKNPRYPFDRRVGGPQNQCGHGGQGEKFQVPAGNRTPYPSHYTDRATAALKLLESYFEISLI